MDVYDFSGSITAAAEDAIVAAHGIAGVLGELQFLVWDDWVAGSWTPCRMPTCYFFATKVATAIVFNNPVEQIDAGSRRYTRDGMAFPVDTRLRPRGGEGELVVTPAQLDILLQTGGPRLGSFDLHQAALSDGI